MAEVRAPDTITFDEERLYVDGVAIRFDVIPQLLYEFAHPDPRRWFRLERVGDVVTVHFKISEEEPNGQPIAHTGRSKENPGGQG